LTDPDLDWLLDPGAAFEPTDDDLVDVAGYPGPDA
jgi:hypothetical protein